jgi:hypothetical protein
VVWLGMTGETPADRMARMPWQDEAEAQVSPEEDDQ